MGTLFVKKIRSYGSTIQFKYFLHFKFEKREKYLFWAN